ncbi:hypothetical protein V5799_022456, partial [Amblyomma americanum]
ELIADVSATSDADTEGNSLFDYHRRPLTLSGLIRPKTAHFVLGLSISWTDGEVMFYSQRARRFVRRRKSDSRKEIKKKG